jgi:hypothetical protein
VAIEQELSGLTNELRALVMALERGGASHVDRETQEFYRKSIDHYSESETAQDRADKYAADRMKSWKELIRVNQRSTVMLSRLAQNSVKQLQTQIESLEDLSDIKHLPVQFAKHLKAFSESKDQQDKVFGELIGEVKTLADVFRVQDKLTKFNEFAVNLRGVKEQLVGLEQAYADGKITLEELEAEQANMAIETQKLGRSLELTDKDLANFGLNVGKLTSDIVNTGENLVNVQVRNSQRYSDSIRGSLEFEAKFFKGLAAVLGGVSGLGANLDDVAKMAAKFGGTIQWTTDSLKTGMSQKELIELQSSYRQSVMALGEGFEGHTKMLLRDQTALYSHIGSVDGVSRANAAFLDLSQTIGGTTDKRSVLGLMDIQGAAFKRLNNTLGITIEQFTSYNEEMLLNAEAQAVFFKTDASNRGKYMEDLYAQFAKLTTTMGMTAEQAKRAQGAFQAIAGSTAKERLAKGAKMAAAASALGRGDLSGYLLDAIRKGETNTERFAEVQKELMAQQKGIIERFGGMGQAGEFFTDALRETTDTNDLLGDKGPMVSAINQLGKSSNLTKATEAINAGLPRTGKEWMEPYWREISPMVGQIQASMSNLDATTKGILGAAVTMAGMKAWGGIKGAWRMGEKAQVGGGLGPAAAEAGGKLKGVGKMLGKRIPQLALAATIAEGGYGLYQGVSAGFRTGEIGEGIKGSLNGLFDLVPGHREALLGKTRAETLDDINNNITPVIADINRHLAEVKIPDNMRIEDMTAESIARMTDAQYNEQTKHLTALREAIEKNGDESRATRFLLEEISAVQKKMSEIDRAALKVQTETATASKTVAEQTKGRDQYLNNLRSAYERGELMRQMNQNMSHVNFRR